MRALAARIPLRLPTADDPAPPTARLVAVSAWAGLLGIIGVAIGVRAGVAMLFDPELPGWFGATVTCVGLVGMALTIGAYFAIQTRELPWLLLAASTGTLGVVTLLTLTIA